MTEYKATPEHWGSIYEDAFHCDAQSACILELRARVEALEARHRPASKVYEISKPLQLTPEQAQQVNDLLAPNSKPTPNPSQTATALAQPEPQGHGPTDEELDELWADIDGGGAIWAWQPYARAVLARWGRPAKPEPQGPTDEELHQLWLELNEFHEGPTSGEVAEIAHTALARWSRPAIEPVPLSERPWEREGWCDPIGKCWWWNPATTTLGTPWWSYSPWEWVEDAAYSLPHWALPVPKSEVHDG
jgi:hypothetical protein